MKQQEKKEINKLKKETKNTIENLNKSLKYFKRRNDYLMCYTIDVELRCYNSFLHQLQMSGWLDGEIE